MTLIAMAIGDKPPILTADILITTRTGQVNMYLPYRAVPLSVDEVKNLKLKPDELKQKLYILPPNICLCVAGGVYAIKLILADFRNYCRWKSNDGKNWLTAEVVQEFFTDYDPVVMAEVVLGVTVAKADKTYFAFTPNKTTSSWQANKTDDFGIVLAAGSGANQYLEHLLWHRQAGSSHEPGDFMYAKQVNLSFITKFLCKENKTLKSLEDYWGGFLETCFFTGERFEKIGDIAFVICDATATETGELPIPIPKLFIYSQYRNDTLYLTTVEASDFDIQETEDAIVYVTPNCVKNLFVVEAIDHNGEPPTLSAVDDLSFSTNNIALGVRVAIDSHATLPMSVYSEGDDLFATFSDGDFLLLVWAKHLHAKQADILKENYPKIKEARDKVSGSENG